MHLDMPWIQAVKGEASPWTMLKKGMVVEVETKIKKILIRIVEERPKPARASPAGLWKVKVIACESDAMGGKIEGQVVGLHFCPDPECVDKKTQGLGGAIHVSRGRPTTYGQALKTTWLSKHTKAVQADQAEEDKESSVANDDDLLGQITLYSGTTQTKKRGTEDSVATPPPGKRARHFGIATPRTLREVAESSDASSDEGGDKRQKTKAEAIRLIEELRRAHGITTPTKGDKEDSLEDEKGVSTQARILRIHTTHPGRLGWGAVEQMNLRLNGLVKRKAVCHSYAVKLTGRLQNQRASRELLTLARLMDHLIKDEVGGALDVAAQRFKAVEMAAKITRDATTAKAKQNAWKRAVFCELEPVEDEMLASFAELRGAERAHLTHQRLEGRMARGGGGRHYHESGSEDDEDDGSEEDGDETRKRTRKRSGKRGRGGKQKEAAKAPGVAAPAAGGKG